MNPVRAEAHRAPRPHRGLLALLVLVAHLALMWGWNAPTARRPARPPAPDSALTWLLLPAAPPVVVPAPPSPPPAAARPSRPDVPRPHSGQPAGREPAKPASTLVLPRLPDPLAPRNLAPTSAPAPDPVAAATEPAGAASEPSGALLMQGDATRRAIREAARQPLLSERAAQATGQPFQRGAERLADAASAAGKGDCLQGEYAGGGMGLLSLPFLAVAAARGRCSR